MSAPPDPPPPRFTLTVEALPDPLAGPRREGVARDPAYRLKLLLKHMLRALGFRCVEVITVLEPPPDTAYPQPAFGPVSGAGRK